jgi:transcriptional regulator with GAF, ATPase, and Fis domain
MDKRFELVRRLGKGGQGRVFLVRDRLRLGKLVALKRLNEQEDHRGALAYEFDYLAKLHHPNLARAFDFSEDDEGWYFTSEFVDGPDILSWSRNAVEQDVYRAMAALLRALALLHDRDLVHGDLSPSNVLISVSEQGGPTPKLLDLGGARRPGQPGKASTLGFTAPEILTGRGVLTSSDLYSFGVLLSMAIFNKNPFGTGNPVETVRRQIAGEIDLPDASIAPTAGLCRELVNPDPAQRPKSAEETIERLAHTANIDLAVHMGALSGGDLPDPRVVGRRLEIAALASLLDRVDDLHGERVALITGPSGIGKSTMLSEIVRFAQLSGFNVVGRAGAPVSGDELLSGLLMSAGQALLSPTSRRALKPWAGGQSKATKDDRQLELSSQSVGFAAAETLAAACALKPVLVAIDDFEQTDSLAQMVAETLLRAVSEERAARPRAAVIIAGDRDNLSRKFPELEALRTDLKPLDARSVDELVSSMLPGVSLPRDLSKDIFLTSEGVPGVAEQLVRQAIGPGDSGDLQARAKKMVASMDQGAKEILAVLSLVRDSSPLGSLKAIGADGDLIDRLVKSGFIYEVKRAEGPEIQAAPAAGIAALEEISAARRDLLVDQLSEWLCGCGRLADAAHLWSEIGKKSAASETLSSLARECLERGDPTGAGAWFQKALTLAPEGQERRSMAREAVDIWRSVGELDLALEWLPAAKIDEGEKALIEAELNLELGRHREALDLAQRSLKRTQDPALDGVIAAAELQLGLHEQALSTALKGLNSTVSDKPNARTARLAQIGGLACIYLGRVEQAASLLEKAASDFETAGDLVGQIKVLANTGMLSRRKGDLSEARRQYDRAVSLAKEAGDRQRQGLHLMNRATVALVAGDIGSAFRDYMIALDIAAVLGNDFARAQVEVNLADLLSGLGDQKAALHATSQAIRRCRSLGQERLEARAVLAAGTATLRAGDLFRAESRLSEARRKFAAAGDDVGRIKADLQLADLYLCKGDIERARDLAEKTADLALERGMSGEMARAFVLTARTMAIKGGDPDRALGMLDEAESLFTAESMPDEIWRLKAHRARILRQAGREDSAEHSLSLARASLEEALSKVPDEYKQSFLGWGEALELTAGETTTDVSTPLNRKALDLMRVMEVNRELAQEHDPKRLLSLIMKYAVELTGAERGMIVMPRGDEMEPVVIHQISDETDVSFSRSVAEKVVNEGRAVLAIDAMGDERFREFVSVHTMKLRSILAVPLRVRRRIVGVVYLDSRLKAGIFSEADRELLEAFGSQAAISLETARLVSENAKRCEDLQRANQEIGNLTVQLEEKLERNEAKLRRVGALLQKTQTTEAERLKENGIIGRAPAMQQIMRMIDRIALTDVQVYIFGASGTGKELVARAIHAQSERRENPFVPVNCGALPPKLLASELFGHMRGAFTGAVGDRPGLFKLADKGTLFLDEVTDMDPEMQAHLLRVLQDGIFRSLGGTEEISVDVRVLSASNRDLDEEVKRGRFREDLFYRLNVVRIDVPPLCERAEDIPLLVDFFAKRHAVDNPPAFSREAMDILMGADWPGNVRELENEVLRAMTMSSPGQPIGPDDLSPRLNKGGTAQTAEGAGSLKDRVDSFERAVLQRALAECGGNATRAAKQLGISRAGFYKKLDKYGLIR